MVNRAGYEGLAAQVEANPVSSEVMSEVEETARGLARNERRTVHHRLERLIEGDMIQAGNIRFGLEYRELANDRGLAIHVLSDVADQEVELLAFDCFEVGPHYHYGPRNQDVRIYWDTTTSGSTLAWTLNEFKTGNIKSMIERAGYPSIANAVDEGLVQELMPKIGVPFLGVGRGQQEVAFTRQLNRARNRGGEYSPPRFLVCRPGSSFERPRVCARGS